MTELTAIQKRALRKLMNQPVKRRKAKRPIKRDTYDLRVYRPLVAVMLVAWAMGVVMMVVTWLR